MNLPFSFLGSALAAMTMSAALTIVPAPVSGPAAPDDHTADLVAQAVCTMLAMGAQECGPFTR